LGQRREGGRVRLSFYFQVAHVGTSLIFGPEFEVPMEFAGLSSKVDMVSNTITKYSQSGVLIKTKPNPPNLPRATRWKMASRITPDLKKRIELTLID
jgi:hypothetical protein